MRKHDLYLIGQGGDGELSFSLDRDAKKLASKDIAAQKFLLYLFTKKGSNPLNPDYGTDFLNVLQKRYAPDVSFLASMFAMASAEAVNYLQRNIPRRFVPEQEISSVNLEYIDARADSLEIRARITTLAGETTEVSIPVGNEL